MTTQRKCRSGQIVNIENGCGCIFCDLDLEPYLAQLKPGEVAAFWHDTKHGAIKCTKPR